MGDSLSLQHAIIYREQLRAAGKIVVVTNGHFDLLHVGHLDYLEKARVLGDALFVGVNGDSGTTTLKGRGRPLVPAAERARLLAALVPVTVTVIFEELTAETLLRALQPDIYVKGGDYHDKPLPERPLVEAMGGRIILIDTVPERSTSALIAKIKALGED